MARCKPLAESFRGIKAGDVISYTVGKGIRKGSRTATVTKVLVRNLAIVDQGSDKEHYIHHNSAEDFVIEKVGTVAAAIEAAVDIAATALADVAETVTDAVEMVTDVEQPVLEIEGL